MLPQSRERPGEDGPDASTGAALAGDAQAGPAPSHPRAAGAEAGRAAVTASTRPRPRGNEERPVARPEAGEPREPGSITSEQLAAAARAGDQRALGMLVGRHADEAFRVALRLSGSHPDAEEVVQGALERVLRHIDRYDPTRPFRPWLMRIVVNQARTHWRVRRVKDLLFGLDSRELAPTTAVVAPDGELSRKELRLVLERAMALLPRDQREAFVLKHVEGYSYEEIAEVTGASVGSLRVRAHRARSTVLAYCRAQGVTPPGGRE